MKAELKSLWLAALRSGGYRQGKRLLNAKTANGNELCCLGVFCEVIGLQMIEGNAINRYRFPSDSEEDLKYGLNQPLLDYTGLTEDQHDELMKMNDGSPAMGYMDAKSFDEIADWIEENIPATSEGEAEAFRNDGLK